MNFIEAVNAIDRTRQKFTHSHGIWRDQTELLQRLEFVAGGDCYSAIIDFINSEFEREEQKIAIQYIESEITLNGEKLYKKIIQ